MVASRIKVIMVIALVLGIFQGKKVIARETIIAKTLDEFLSAGWQTNGVNPQEFVKPSDWNSNLEPLDARIVDGAVWMYENTNPNADFETNFSFSKFTSGDDQLYCDITSVNLHLNYYSENASLFASPCEDVTGANCYFDPVPEDGIKWQLKVTSINVQELEDSKLNVKASLTRGGFVFFNQITISYEGNDCSPTSTVSTSEDPTETATSPTSTQTTTEITATTTETICPTTAPPSSCDCCDRCPTNDVHHHHYYYSPFLHTKTIQ